MAQSSGGSSTGVIIKGNVYGGGNLGDVGIITKSDDLRTFEWVDGTGVCEVSITSSTAVIEGNVFGAGKGEATTFECEKAMVHSSSVSIENGTVNGNVYGGGEVGRVEYDTEVTIGPESGTGTPKINRSVFGAGAGVGTHGYSALVRRNTKVTIQSKAEIGHSVYGGGEIASVGKYGLDEHKMPSILLGGGECIVTVKGEAKIGTSGTGDVFGASKGVDPHFDKSNEDKTKRSRRMTLYTNSTDFPDDDINDTWEYCDATTHRIVWEYFQDEDAYLTFLETLALATHPDVTITESATVNGDVYGGGEMGLTKGSVDVKISGGTITKDVYGGGALANTNISNWNAHAGTWLLKDDNNVTIYTPPTESSQASTKYKTNVILTGGTIGGNVYGGGLGQKADPDDPTVKAIEAKVYGDVLVTLNGAPVTETINGEEVITSFDPPDENCKCVVKGSIFGCNNQNGSPQNTVTVHVWKTQGWTGHDVSDGKADASIGKTGTTYELTAVYGGGNLAAYEPVNANGNATEKAQTYTNVIIEGCDLTSIKQVYGGGNAASVPATKLTIESAYEIGEVFGGGNGLDPFDLYYKTYENPGANVGYKNYTTFVWDSDKSQYKAVVNSDADTKEERLSSEYRYGSGEASVNVYGGRVHRVFGGSNTKGNVRVTAVTILDNNDPCDLNIDEAYGGGKSAPMDAEAKLLMSCIPGLAAAYGGAQEADVGGNVVLNITNGTFDRVFGGNNISGTINGSITVNIEETGCRPLIIGELYGGGNEAKYSVYGYNSDKTPITSGTPQWDDPVVNVKSFTSIGSVYGGGFGSTADMYGNPTVNINVGEGDWYDKDQSVVGSVNANGTTTDGTTTGGYTIPYHVKGRIGAIQNVYGGGNAAPVHGSTKVNIGVLAYEEVASVIVGRTDVRRYYTRTGAGTTASPYVYTKVTSSPVDGTTYYSFNGEDYEVVTVTEGTDVSNYYTRTGGAGTTESPYEYTLVPVLAETGKKYYMPVIGADIRGNVYGGGNEADVTGNTDVTIGKE